MRWLIVMMFIIWGVPLIANIVRVNHACDLHEDGTLGRTEQCLLAMRIYKDDDQWNFNEPLTITKKSRRQLANSDPAKMTYTRADFPHLDNPEPVEVAVRAPAPDKGPGGATVRPKRDTSRDSEWNRSSTNWDAYR